MESRIFVESIAHGGYHALIDAGALITGMTNKEVAQFLLREGMLPPSMLGVVYLNTDDAKVILTRTGKTMPLSRSDIRWENRFSFYDQVHTTGMDIPQYISARALLTIGKDMTFRDYAQAAFRMRGIAKGQTIQLLLTPEVAKLVYINSEKGMGRAVSEDAVCPDNMAVAELLKRIASWLVINSCRSERVQFNLLSDQSIRNVYRKESYYTCVRKHKLFGSLEEEELRRAISVFREPLDYSVTNAVSNKEKFSVKLREIIKSHVEFIDKNKDGRNLVRMLLSK